MRELAEITDLIDTKTNLSNLLLSLDSISSSTRSRVNSLRSTKDSASSVSSFKSAYSSPPLTPSVNASRSNKSPITLNFLSSPGSDLIFLSPSTSTAMSLLPQGWSGKSLDDKMTALMELLFSEQSMKKKFDELSTQIEELKADQTNTSEKLEEVTTNVQVNADAISKIHKELSELKTQVTTDKESLQEKLSSLGNLNTVGFNPSSSAIATSSVLQSAAELVISGIPDPVIDELPPTDIPTAILNYLKLPHLTNDVQTIRKFNSNLKQNASNTRNENAHSMHSFLVCMKSSQVRDFIIDTKRKTKFLPAKDIFPGMIDNNYREIIYINEFLHTDTHKLLLKTKEKAKIMNFKYVWVRSGHIFAKKDDNSDRLNIASAADLSKLE